MAFKFSFLVLIFAFAAEECVRVVSDPATFLSESEAMLIKGGECYNTDLHLCEFVFNPVGDCAGAVCDGAGINRTCSKGGKDLSVTQTNSAYTTLREATIYGFVCAQQNQNEEPCITAVVCKAGLCDVDPNGGGWSCKTQNEERGKFRRGWIVYNPTGGCGSCVVPPSM